MIHPTRNPAHRAVALAAAALVALAPIGRGAPDPDTIWVEGECADFSQVDRHPWWYDRVRHDALFGGDWISHYSENRPGEAEYEVDVCRAGDYTLWLRANPIRSRLSYQLDGARWMPIDAGRDRGELINLAEDGKEDLRFIAWIRVGPITLDAGMHRIAFKMHGETTQHGGIDCFVLALGPFAPPNPPAAKQPVEPPGSPKPDIQPARRDPKSRE